MAEVLYRWPQTAAFGKRVPKEKFYEHGSLSASLRQQFVVQLERIEWSFKLAESTIRLPGNDDVPEIQVFTIVAKGDDVSDEILTAIDKSIPSPIIFEVTRQVKERSEVRMVAAHKELGSGARKAAKVGSYFSTGWQSVDVVRLPLPAAISLTALYAALLQPLMPLTPRAGEKPSDLTDRMVTIRRLEREVASLERKLHAEPQFNRKVEIRHTLRAKQAELERQR